MALTPVSGANRPELLLSVLHDTENLSAFVRYSALPTEVKAELLLEISRQAAGGTRLSDRSLAKISDVLGGIRPQSAGGDATYQDNAVTDMRSAKVDGIMDNTIGAVNFVAFRPSQSDFEKTIDNITLDGAPGDDAPDDDQIFGVVPLVFSAHDPFHISLNLFLAVSVVVGIAVLGFWIF